MPASSQWLRPDADIVSERRVDVPQELRREYLSFLPLPLAQLYGRAHWAKSSHDQHDITFQLFEALIKLATSPLVAAYVAEVRRREGRVQAIDRRLGRLALPSLGHW